MSQKYGNESASDLRKDLAKALQDNETAPEIDKRRAALAAKKKEESDRWLRNLGRILWAFFIMTLLIPLAIHSASDAPPEAENIRTQLESLEAQWDELKSLELERGIEPAVVETVQSLTNAIGVQAQALMERAEKLPTTWGGHSLDREVSILKTEADKMLTASSEIREAAQLSPPDLTLINSGLATGNMSYLAAANVDLSPGWRWPWDYRDAGLKIIFAALGLTVAMLATLSLIFRPQGGLRFFLTGSDGRLSTSQTQVALWSIGVFFLISAVLMGPEPEAFDSLDENYLLLLGGPYAAWVIGGAVTRGKIEDNAIQKISTPQAQVKDLVADDDGKASISDAQFFIFSVLALIGVLVAFVDEPWRIPPIPTGLAMLTSAAALVYTGKKVTDRNAPTVFSVTRADGPGPFHPEVLVTIQGINFVPPGAGGDLDVLAGISVRLKTQSTTHDERVRPDVDPNNCSTAIRARKMVKNVMDERLVVRLPVGISGLLRISVITAAGAESNEYLLMVEPA